MTITSLVFFAFVLLSLIVYYIWPVKSRWIVLLISSLTFYAINSWKYSYFILFTALSTFFGAIFIEKVAKKSKEIVKANKETWTKEEKKAYKNSVVKKKRLILALILVLNFGILFVLKYSNFIVGSLTSLFGLPSLNIGFILPLGISFYTFQTMGYITDVYRGRNEAQKNFAKLLLFISFFPQIVQGPIAIYDDLASQLYEGHKFEYTNFKHGFELIIWGLVKKMVIADRLVVLMNTVLDNQTKYGGEMIVFSAVVYAIQLYADFSGGIDVSRGVAEMFGINMTENFRRPYFSKSVSEYWRRWHISLGAWMKNYVFYPLAMSKAFQKLGKKTKEKLGGHVGEVLPGSIAIFVVFLLIGIWHGANWKYVGFGLYNATIIFISNLLDPVYKKINKKLKIRTESFSFRVVQILRTFILILISYYTDLADNLANVFVMLKRSVCDFHIGNLLSVSVIKSLGLGVSDLIIAVVGVILIFCVSLYQERTNNKIRDVLENQSVWLQWAVLTAGLLLIVFLGMYGPGIKSGEFVYMQF